MSRYTDEGGVSVESRQIGDEPVYENELALFVHFSHPSEMRKAYEFLSSISCTIRHNPPASARDLIKLSESEVPGYSMREGEVLTLLAKGCSYSEIAACLGCKISTIQTHVKNIYSKMGVHSRAQAVHEALQIGLIQI